jgi:hypothetical protein
VIRERTAYGLVNEVGPPEDQQLDGAEQYDALAAPINAVDHVADA